MISRIFRHPLTLLLLALGVAVVLSRARAGEQRDAPAPPLANTWCADHCDAVMRCPGSSRTR
jgi:hypothetical protein